MSPVIVYVIVIEDGNSEVRAAVKEQTGHRQRRSTKHAATELTTRCNVANYVVTQQ